MCCLQYEYQLNSKEFPSDFFVLKAEKTMIPLVDVKDSIRDVCLTWKIQTKCNENRDITQLLISNRIIT